MGLVNGCLYVKARSTLKHNWGPTTGTFREMQERKSQKTERFSSALKFKHWTPIYGIFKKKKNLNMEKYLCITSECVLSIPPCVLQAVGLSQRPPEHHGYGFDSSGIMRELGLGCWEGTWQHSSLDPVLILGNPSRAHSCLTHGSSVGAGNRRNICCSVHRLHDELSLI